MRDQVIAKLLKNSLKATKSVNLRIEDKEVKCFRSKEGQEKMQRARKREKRKRERVLKGAWCAIPILYATARKRHQLVSSYRARVKGAATVRV